MNTEPRLDVIGAALADPSRVRILCELMDGRAFTNKELASAAGVTPQTATGHLQKLRSAGLVTSVKSGRHVFHRIANEEVAETLERLSALSPTDHLYSGKGRSLPGDEALLARSCYNHLAGRLGVLIAERLISRGLLEVTDGGASFAPEGVAVFERLGIEIGASGRRPLVSLCLDWTERKHHLSGPLAAAFLDRALAAGWLARRQGSRALTLTDAGAEVLRDAFSISEADLNR